MTMGYLIQVPFNFSKTFYYHTQKIVEDDMRSLLFGDYQNPDAIGEDRLYQEVESVDKLITTVEGCLEEYNQTHKTQMKLVIFR